MQTTQLTLVALLLSYAAAAPTWADVAPPPSPCTVQDRQASGKKCVQCTATSCAVSAADGYYLECSDGSVRIWCEDSGGCSAGRISESASRAGQLLLVAVLGVFGFALFRRSRSPK